MVITHIINPVKVPRTSDLHKAQPVTFESMRRAKEFAGNELDIHLISTQYPEDYEVIPNFITKTADLERSILDLGEFKVHRKLPLIHDIIERAIQFDSSTDYIIYSNSDIALMPHFYLFVKDQIENGLDSFVINRRTISETYSLDSLNTAYSDYGDSHPGFDCFVFKLEYAKKFILGSICIGTTRIGLALISNLIFNSTSFEVFKDEHLTFHIGEDKVWLNPDYNDYVNHNEVEVMKILTKLRKQDRVKFEASELILKYYKQLKDKGVKRNKSFLKRFKR